MAMGFKAHTYNSEFILRKATPSYNLSLHQSIEPYNHVLAKYIDFEVEEDFAYLVIEFKTHQKNREQKVERIGDLFDYMFDRERFVFCTSKKMTITDRKLKFILKEVEAILAGEF